MRSYMHCPPLLSVAGAGTAAHSESETLAKYEIMDGAPVRGESVPIRCVEQLSGDGTSNCGMDIVQQ